MFVDTQKVHELAKYISPTRNDAVSKWLEVGSILKKMSNSFLDIWMDFSSKENKTKCKKIWRELKYSESDAHFAMSHFDRIIQTDSPNEFKSYYERTIKKLARKCLSGNITDFADLAYHAKRFVMICSDIRRDTWYRYNNHKWEQVPSYRIQNEVIPLLEKNPCLNDKIRMKFRLVSFRHNFMREFTMRCYCPNFEQHLDSNPNLLHFNNGVYDLKTNVFRQGYPDDYISLTTFNKYFPLDPEDKITKKIMDFLQGFVHGEMTKEDLLDTLVDVFEPVRIVPQIWYGEGSTGKSSLSHLISGCFGEYSGHLPYLIKNNSPEMAQMKGKRIAYCFEPERESIRYNYLMEMTGGDRVVAKPLWKAPFKFTPLFTPILVCDTLPENYEMVKNKMIHFKNKFKYDKSMRNKLDEWKEGMMSILLHHYRNKIKIDRKNI